jgi:hypothetical protein
MKKQSVSALILAASTLSLVSISPAQAAPVSCSAGFGGFGLGWNILSLTGLSPDGCFIGDKVYSGFSFSGISQGGFNFTISGADHTFSGSGLNFTGSNFSYSYTISLFNPPVGQEFFKYNTNAAGSGAGSALAFSKSLTTPLPTTSTATELLPGNIVTFPAGTVSPLTFTSNLSRTGGKIDTITDTLSQKIGEPLSTVPGPLPILGAGAAFGFSRRLRNRIKQLS